jgi:methyl-accepting chemotaxis protein
MNVFKDASISKKLMILLAIFIVGYTIFGLISFSTLNTLRIHGNLYNQIVMSKDLIADVLPPPGYIIESYLDVLQMTEETDPARMDYFIKELKRLEADYNERHQFWVNERLLEPGSLRDAMLIGAYDPAVRFFDIVSRQFIPALQSGNREQAKNLAQGELKTLYTTHRKSVDQVVLGATEKYENIEILANITIQRDTKMLLAIAFVVIVAAVILSLTIRSSIVKPVIKITDMLKNISEGEGDLTQQIMVTGKDETSDMARYFNKTLEKIKNLVLIIKKQANMLSEIGSDLASNTTKTAAAVNQITANIQSIKGRIINQSASVTQTNATMEQVIANINKLNGHVEKQSSNVSQASSAIEEMVANISSVTNTLVNNTANVNTLKEASEVGRNGLQGVATDIQEISRESEGLLQINLVMKSIASQTNLLSMNAAIEAAHAGEAGKGFAVVANEIRKLAESSSEQSKTIGNVLKKIKESIDKITKSTENVLTKFEAIDSSVRTVSEQEENIRNAMEEQGEGSKQVLQSASSLSGLTQQVKSGSEEMLEGSKEVMKESRNLEKATQEITGGMNEMASGAEHVNIAVNNVNEISNKNHDAIDALLREVSRFKVE